MHNYKLQEARGPADDFYNEIVPEVLADKVYEENQLLLNKIKEAQMSDVIKNVFSLYDTRFKKLSECLEKFPSYRGYISSVAQFFTIFEKEKTPKYENVGKIFLFSICYTELTGEKQGYQLLSDEHITIKTIKEQAKNHKDAPKNFFYTEEEGTHFLTKMEDYPNYIQIGLTYVEILNSVIEGEYKDALKMLAKQKEYTPDFKGANIARDIVKLLSLRYASCMNQAIIGGSAYHQKILPIFNAFCFIFREIIPDFEDNHYAQMVINLENTFELAQNKMDGYKDEFESWIQIFKRKDLSEVVLDNSWTPCFTQELSSQLSKVASANYYTWDDNMYNDKVNLAIAYKETFDLFKTSFESWIKAHKSIYKKSSNPLSGKAWLEMEENEGILLRAFVSS